jgi:hypothetical protein
MVFQFSFVLGNCLGDDDSIFVPEYLGSKSFNQLDENIFKFTENSVKLLNRQTPHMTAQLRVVAS